VGPYLASLQLGAHVWDLSTNGCMLVAQRVESAAFEWAVEPLARLASTWLDEDRWGIDVRRSWLDDQVGRPVWPRWDLCTLCKGTGRASDDCILCHRHTCTLCDGRRQVHTEVPMRKGCIVGVAMDLNKVAVALEVAGRGDVMVRTFDQDRGVALMGDRGTWQAFVMGLVGPVDGPRILCADYEIAAARGSTEIGTGGVA
jgi:hypothetical protein